MIPETLLRQLHQLRFRELFLRFVWNVGRWSVVLGAALLLSLGLDWLIDIYQDTPYSLRAFLLGLQVGLWTLAFLVVIRGIVFHELTRDRLALMVEDRLPNFDHRLISTLQLQQGDGVPSGMSVEMIEAVSSQTEKEAADLSFARLLDSSRAIKGFGFLLIPLAVGLLGWSLCPDTLSALMRRLFLADVAIPRRIHLEPISAKVWPISEDGTIRYRVVGRRTEEVLTGQVVVRTEGRSPQVLPLVPNASDPDVYEAVLPSPSSNFTYLGRLGDGRTKQPAAVHLEPRPAVIDLEAILYLPDFSGKRINGQPFTEIQHHGDIVGLPGLRADIKIHTQKLIQTGELELVGQPWPGVLAHLASGVGTLPAVPLGSAWLNAVRFHAIATQDALPTASVPLHANLGPEVVLHRVPVQSLESSEAFQVAQVSFRLRYPWSAYRFRLTDLHGFQNLEAPKRSISVSLDEPPRVNLLSEAERLGGDRDLVESMPIEEEGMIPIVYEAEDHYGVARAQLKYRIDDGEWKTLPLEVNSGNQVQFALVHELVEGPPRKARGTFDFFTKGILKAGDTFEYYVEVFDRNPTAGRLPGESPSRTKKIVSKGDLLVWMRNALQDGARIRTLNTQQGEVFPIRRRD